MNKIGTIMATWVLELNTQCPKCGEVMDLVEHGDLWDIGIEACETGTERSNNLDVFCTKCQHEFSVCCEY